MPEESPPTALAQEHEPPASQPCSIRRRCHGVRASAVRSGCCDAGARAEALAGSDSLPCCRAAGFALAGRPLKPEEGAAQAPTPKAGRRLAGAECGSAMVYMG